MPSRDYSLLKGLTLLVGLALVLLVCWNILDPMPPAWDEAQHLLLAQLFGEQVHRFQQDPRWWQQFHYLSQRYPPLTYWLSLPFSVWTTFDRHSGQLLNLIQLGILALVTQRLGSAAWNTLTGWLAAALILLFPATTGLAHVYMTDLTLVVTVTLGFWAALSYWQRPTYLRALGLGISLGFILLAKWNGILFLALPLLACTLRILGQWRLHLWGQGILISTLTGLISWPWYGPNWLFVLSNGFNYAATTHYYVQCTAGSFCWWTLYLRWLPRQLSPLLCVLPVLAWIPSTRLIPTTQSSLFGFGFRRVQNSLLHWLDSLPVGRVGSFIALTYLSGYLLYTLIGIKDSRFSLPLLPLLAVLSAIGLQKLSYWLNPSPLIIGTATTCGLVTLAFLGQPFTPGTTPFWQTLHKVYTHQDPQHHLQTWLATQGHPQDPVQTTIGVIPNTELLSSETLTYLAKVNHLPLAFFPAGQSQWPDLELKLTDRFLSSPDDWGVIGPFQESKDSILTALQSSTDWIPSHHMAIPDVGILQIFQQHQDPVQIKVLPAAANTQVDLKSIRQLKHCQVTDASCPEPSPLVPVWEMQWRGPSNLLARTTVWVDFLDPEGILLDTQDFILGEGRLRLDHTDPLLLTHRLAFNTPLEQQEGPYQLLLRWQTGPEDPVQTQQVTTLFDLETDPFKSQHQPSPLQLAAAAAELGDLDNLSRYLSLWTTRRYTPVVVDPQLDHLKRLLEYRLQEAQNQGSQAEQIALHYQLGLLGVTQVNAQAAQPHFEALVQLQPDNPWNPAYVSFLKLVFNRDFRAFKQQLSAVAYPFYLSQGFCQPTDPPTTHWGCDLLRSWELLPGEGSWQSVSE